VAYSASLIYLLQRIGFICDSPFPIPILLAILEKDLGSGAELLLGRGGSEGLICICWRLFFSLILEWMGAWMACGLEWDEGIEDDMA
jgi:hypothetical protein